MRIVEAGVRPPTRVAIYGNPKCGKTRLATSLPWGPLWGEKAVYVAWDKGAEERSSVLARDLERLQCVMPEANEKGEYDPLTEAVEIASHDWKSKGFGTLIWDTMSSTALELLDAISAQSLYGKNLVIGRGAAKITQPQKGDYGAAQRATMHILNFLFDQPINIIVLFHVQAPDLESEMEGGPATV